MTMLDFNVILPELILAIYAMLALLWGVYFPRKNTALHMVWATVALFLVMAFFIGSSQDPESYAFGGLYVNDDFAKFAKVLILLSAAMVLIMSQDYMSRLSLMRFEFPILVAFSVVGMMVMVSSANLMTLYMGLELQSLSLYVLAAMRRDNIRSSEAGLKYFVLGALSSGLFLYGASLIYGYSGTTQFSEILSNLSQMGAQEVPFGVLIGLVFILSALAFKISAAPFHMWTPDVYEGAPTSITALFATAPKVAAILLIARLVYDGFGAISADWRQVLVVLSLISMFWGAFAGIGQTNIKRLMAYSSISHMGYALLGLAAGTPEGLEATLVYMAVYVTMNIGTFAFILSMRRDDQPVSDIASLSMLSKSAPLYAFALLVLIFSMAGVPPMLGFFTKFFVLKAVVDAGMTWLAIAGVLASVIGAFYYLRLVFLMYFGKEQEERLVSVMTLPQWGVMMGCASVMLLGVIHLFGVDVAAATAAVSLVR